MKLFHMLLFVFVAFISFGQPGSEIFLVDLYEKGNNISLGNPVNITRRPGYDNQPYFHPDKPVIYYSSFNKEGRADIKIFNYKKRITELFTQTIEREYSPTVTPDKKFISCIIQRDNNAQDLGKYPINGGAPEVIINSLIVGYHAWMNKESIILFVLGDPFTLRHYNTRTKKDTILAEYVGRSLHKIPGEEAVSFIDKSQLLHWYVKKVLPDLSIQTIIEIAPGREDIAWTPDGKIISSDGNQFFFFKPGQTAKWQLFNSGMLVGVTRLAVSPDGKKMAVVLSE